MLRLRVFRKRYHGYWWQMKEYGSGFVSKSLTRPPLPRQRSHLIIFLPKKHINFVYPTELWVNSRLVKIKLNQDIAWRRQIQSGTVGTVQSVPTRAQRSHNNKPAYSQWKDFWIWIRGTTHHRASKVFIELSWINEIKKKLLRRKTNPNNSR